VDLEADLNNGRYQEASRLSWERFRELFEAEYFPNCRLGTRDVFGMALDQFEQICNPKTLRAINERTVSAFVAGLRKRPGRRKGQTMAPGTIKVRLQFLHTVLTWGVEQKLLPGCPRFPFVKVPKKKPQPIPAESFEKLLDKAPDANMRVYLLCGWLAGLRLVEAMLLEWEATEAAPYVDFDRDQIVLPAGFVKAAEDQWVPLDPVLREALLQLPRHGPRVFRFISRETKGPLTDAALSCRVLALARKAGVKLSMHSLRKGFGCRYAGKVPAQVLQKLMRHASISTTMDYYANVDDAVRAAVQGECNGPRNKRPARPEEGQKVSDATAVKEGTSGGEAFSCDR
jgi:integrase